ncbi:hypothetical protein AAZX31_09G032000 [Glycine max]
MEIKPEEYSRRQLKESKFKKGIVEEVSRDDKGYKGVWFLDTVVDIIGKDRFQVEYRDLKTNGGTQLLKEEIDARLIRPCPPEVSFAGPFKQFQEVDACVIFFLISLASFFLLFFFWRKCLNKSSELVKKFGDMMPKTKNSTGIKVMLKRHKPNDSSKKPRDVTARTMNTQSKFVAHSCKGENVENGKYLVEYLTLKTDDWTEQLKEVADASDIRPYPPDWVGQVSSVLPGFKYKVYFWHTKEEQELDHCHLRPHQEWIFGKWVLASLV